MRAKTGLAWEIVTLVLAAGLAGDATGGGAAGTTESPAPEFRLADPSTILPLAPFLDRREILIIESRPDGTAAQTLSVSVFPQPVDAVLAVLCDVRSFPHLSPNMIRIEVSQIDPDTCEYDWEIEVPLFNLSGRNRRRVDRARRRVQIHTLRGDVTPAGALWELHPLPDGRTLAQVASYSNVRQASMFLASFIDETPYKEQVMVAEATYATVRNLKTYLQERAAHAGDPEWKVQAPHDLARSFALRSAFDPEHAVPRERLAPLLDWGEVAVFRFTGPRHTDPLAQVSVYGRVAAPARLVEERAAEPRRWPRMIPDIERVKKLSESAGLARFELTYGYSMMTFDVQAIARLADPQWVIRFQVTGGDLGTGAMGWQVEPLDERSCVVANSRLTDPTQGNFMLRQMVEASRLTQQSINMNRSFLAVRAIKLSAEKEARLRR